MATACPAIAVSRTRQNDSGVEQGDVTRSIIPEPRSTYSETASDAGLIRVIVSVQRVESVKPLQEVF